MQSHVTLPLDSASTYDGDLWVFVETKKAHLEGWAWVALDQQGNIVDRSEFQLDRGFTGSRSTGPIWWAYADGIFRDSREALQSPSGELYHDLVVPTDEYPHPLPAGPGLSNR